MIASEGEPFGWWANEWLKGAKDATGVTWGENESMVFDRVHGFFCYIFTPGMRLMSITKGCGDIHWAKKIGAGIFYEAKRLCGTEYLIVHTQRRPRAMARIMNGEVYDILPGRKGKPKYWIRTKDPLNLEAI